MNEKNTKYLNSIFLKIRKINGVKNKIPPSILPSLPPALYNLKNSKEREKI